MASSAVSGTALSSCFLFLEHSLLMASQVCVPAINACAGALQHRSLCSSTRVLGEWVGMGVLTRAAHSSVHCFSSREETGGRARWSAFSQG